MYSIAAIISARLAIGLVISASIGVVAYRRKALSRSGIAGAIITGTLTFGLGGFASGFLLVVFFVTSSLLSQYKAQRKATVAAMFDKGGQRDLGQALANGGAAALFAACSGIALLAGASPSIVMAALAAVIGALAAASADTWATELGVLSRTTPRLITHWRQRVETGASGGITTTGLLAAAGGALCIGITYVLIVLLASLLNLNRPDLQVILTNVPINDIRQSAWLAPLALVSGFCGSLFDSLLGATLQAMYFSERRQKLTERPVEHDGVRNHMVRGRKWITNDWVNFASTFAGALICAVLFSYFVA